MIGGQASSTKKMVRRVKGMDEIVTEVGAVRVNWKGAGSPTFTSGNQKTMSGSTALKKEGAKSGGIETVRR